MKGVCPSCGAIHSAEAFFNDAAARLAVGIVAELPRSVARLALPYTGLFRPRPEPGSRSYGQGLIWKRAARLLGELRDLVAAGHVQWDRRPARPCSPETWAEAMEKMLLHPPRELPLESHGYLRKVAYGLADQADRASEQLQIRSERSGTRPPREDDGGAEGLGEVLDRGWMRDVRLKAKGERPKGTNGDNHEL